MLLTLALLLVTQVFHSEAAPAHRIHGLRARFDPSTDSIYAEWSLVNKEEGIIPFMIRYRTVGNTEWEYSRTRHSHLRLELPDVKNNDQVEVQVRPDEKTNDDWSHTLLITVQKRVMIGGIALDEGQLVPPLDFTAHILSPSSVRLQWKPTEIKPDIVYLVNVKQTTSAHGEAMHRQQIKTSANSFTLENLVPGERYEMTIRSSSPKHEMSSAAAVVEINLPYDEEFFEIGNLIISSHFMGNGQGTVSLTWDVPHHMTHRIRAYDVKYAESGSEDWQQIQFSGARASASLQNLKSNTEYQLKIRTTLDNNMVTESGHFRFKTPKVEVNPISKVDVIYSHEVNAVRLHWVLQSHVDVEKVAGYDVYLSEDKDAPEHTWKHTRVDTPEGALSLDHLKSLHTYYVRVNVRTVDGQVIKAPAIYRFKTIDSDVDGVARGGNTLKYVNVAPGEVVVSWTFHPNVRHLVTGSKVMYIERDQMSNQEQWKQVIVEGTNNQTVHLSGLRMGTKYYVQIVPKLVNGDFAPQYREHLEVTVDIVEWKPSKVVMDKENQRFNIPVGLPPKRVVRTNKAPES